MSCTVLTFETVTRVTQVEQIYKQNSSCFRQLWQPLKVFTMNDQTQLILSMIEWITSFTYARLHMHVTRTDTGPKRCQSGVYVCCVCCVRLGVYVYVCT